MLLFFGALRLIARRSARPISAFVIDSMTFAASFTRTPGIVDRATASTRSRNSSGSSVSSWRGLAAYGAPSTGVRTTLATISMEPPPFVRLGRTFARRSTGDVSKGRYRSPDPVRTKRFVIFATAQLLQCRLTTKLSDGAPTHQHAGAPALVRAIGSTARGRALYVSRRSLQRLVRRHGNRKTLMDLQEQLGLPLSSAERTAQA
jgi:hypothetical protein